MSRENPTATLLFERFGSMADLRAVRGRRDPLACLLTIATCAVFTGAQGYETIADFASSLTQPQRRIPRCRHRGDTFDVPCASTFWELFNRIDGDELDQVVCDALRDLQGDRPEAIAVDRKTVRST